MKSILVVALIALAPSLASAQQKYNADFVTELHSLGLHEAAFDYALIWVGNGDPEAEFEIASLILEGIGTTADPIAAIHFACGDRQMSNYEVDKIVIKANLRLIGTSEKVHRCSVTE